MEMISSDTLWPASLAIDRAHTYFSFKDVVICAGISRGIHRLLVSPDKKFRVFHMDLVCISSRLLSVDISGLHTINILGVGFELCNLLYYVAGLVAAGASSLEVLRIQEQSYVSFSQEETDDYKFDINESLYVLLRALGSAHRKGLSHLELDLRTVRL